jgi:hypothetical protein
MTDTPDRDPCDDLLRAEPPSQDDRLRQQVWRRTQGLLRRRRWGKRAAVAAALAACFLAGVGTGRLGTERLPADKGVVASTGPGPVHPPIEPLEQTSSSALALEWQALDSSQPQPELARQAGDRYAADEGDYQSALRCYRDALDADTDRTIKPSDSWLLMVLKNARQKEKPYATSRD